MSQIACLALKISSHKCFRDNFEGFEEIHPINVVIGRNNSGKSALLDAIEIATFSNTQEAKVWSNYKNVEIMFSAQLRKDEIVSVFPKGRSGGPISGDHYDWGKRWIGSRITWKQKGSREREFISLEPPLPELATNEYATKLTDHAFQPMNGMTFKRLLADRDITRESERNDLEISGNGEGFTSTVAKIINEERLPSDLIERTFLNELNSIFYPDAKFTDIVVQRFSNGEWEIFLEEEHKGRVGLTNSGSGLKTILLVLSLTVILPRIQKYDIRNCIICVEEPENNLHPSLFRRFLSYVRNLANDNGVHFFITTHSNVAIDYFGHDPIAQILHVRHDGQNASVKKVQTYVDNTGVLDDLDIRASDLLQSNGIIWVEGPSDRLYFNRWIELFSSGSLTEGTHYQCLTYGGRLLAHLTAIEPNENVDQLINLLLVNRNCLIIMDRDEASLGKNLNQTKTRVIEEFRRLDSMAWVTSGREIENYIPKSALESLTGKKIPRALGKRDYFSKFLSRHASEEAKRFNRSKVLFAERICPHITMAGVQNTHDLYQKVKESASHIRRWNKLTN